MKIYEGNVTFRFRREGHGICVSVCIDAGQPIVEFPLNSEANVRAFVQALAATAGLPAPWNGR